MARQDIHRPSVIQPQDYEFVASDYYGADGWVEKSMAYDRRILREHMIKTGGKFSNHDHGGTCHVCGANARYVAHFYHRKNNQYITTGEECADKMGFKCSSVFKKLRKRVGEDRKRFAREAAAEAYLVNKGLFAAWAIFIDQNRPDKYEENTIASIVHNLVRYGNLSDRQEDFVRKLVAQIPERAAKEQAVAAKLAAAKPVPTFTGRTTIKAKILGFKTVEGPFGIQTKMLVEHEDGWKLWGTRPAGLKAEKGDVVEFVAKIEASKDDPKFGFFSRPTQAEVVG